MTTMSQLRYSPLTNHHRRHHHQPCSRFLPIPPTNSSFPSSRDLTSRISLPHPSNPISSSQILFRPCASTGDGGIIGGGNSGGTGGSGGRGDGKHNNPDDSSRHDNFGPFGFFLKGWQSRVTADPQFPFKVLMEELVGVSACVLGDMASRPNFGLNELDFVFSTLIVGSIMNFVLMYLLAPTMASSSTLPSIFATCPTSHMFEPGAFGLLDRLGTFVYKGVLFAGVGFAAGLVGTAISNGLISVRKKMDPEFESPNKPPPPLLNATTWALHMGLSSNLRYQTLNGAEFLLARALPSAVFKSSVIVLRLVNNVLGGMSFVILARMTGSQSVAAPPDDVEKTSIVVKTGSNSNADVKLKLVDHQEVHDQQNQTNLPTN